MIIKITEIWISNLVRTTRFWSNINKTDRHGIAEILIDYCVTSNEQYISYTQAEEQFKSI
jgi:hypothetical protein